MSKPFVSIIVPIYNSKKYIYECVNSLIVQSLKNIEIILVDDGSTDETSMIIDNFAKKDNRIKVIHQKNKKQGGARNTGIKIATGDYIAFIDSDDWVDIHFIKKMYEKAINTNSDIVMCDYYRAKSFNNFKKNNKSRIDKIFLNNKKINLKTSVKQPIRKSGFGMVVCWNKLFKTELAKKFLEFPENLFFEDSAPVLRCLANANSISVLNEKLYFYRISNLSSTTHSKDIKRFDLIKVQNILINDLDKYDFGNFKNFCITFMVKDLIKHFSEIDYSFKLAFYKELKSILLKLKEKNYLSLIDKKYQIKSWFFLNTNYTTSLLIANL